MIMKFIYFLSIIVLSGCYSSVQHKSNFMLMSKPQAVDESSIKQRPHIPTIKQVISLNQKQHKKFLESYNNKNNSLLPSRRVFAYMQDHLKSASYSAETLTASNVLSQNSGNCLSLAILTKSLADAAGIGIRYEMVKVPPVFKRSNDIILSSQHIRSILYNSEIKKDKIPGKMMKSITIDYNPSEQTKALRWVDEDEFYSLYYTNRAAELLAQNKIDESYWYLKEALTIKSSSVQAINMMGIVHSRLGYDTYAEQWYLYGLSFGRGQFELLKNYYLLLQRTDRGNEADKVALQLSQYDADNPFDWVALGDDAYENKKYKLAIKYYKKAVIMARYLHEPYAGIARSHFKLGNTKKAHKAMTKAIKNTKKGDVISIYQEKYDSLSDQLNKK